MHRQKLEYGQVLLDLTRSEVTYVFIKKNGLCADIQLAPMGMWGFSISAILRGGYTRNCQNKCSSNPPNLFFIKIKKAIVETRILKGSGPWCYTAFSYSIILKVCLMLQNLLVAPDLMEFCGGFICIVTYGDNLWISINIFIWVLHTFRKCNEIHQCLVYSLFDNITHGLSVPRASCSACPR